MEIDHAEIEIEPGLEIEDSFESLFKGIDMAISSEFRFMSIIIFGEAKVGKTWLAATAPKPLLVLDAEAGGMRFVPGRKIKWNVTEEDPPVYDGTWDICVASITNTRELDVARDWIASGQLPFRTIILDSLTEFQSRYKREINPARDGDLGYTGWGRMLIKLEDFVVQLRDIGERYTDTIECIGIVTGATDKFGKKWPLLQGQLAELLPYKTDVIGYLTIEWDDENEARRLLQIMQSETVMAGNRLGGFIDDYVWDPDLSVMIDQIEDGLKNLERMENANNLS